VNTTGKYWLQIQKNSCSATDTILVQFNPVPSFSLGADTVLCENNTLKITSSIAGDTYLWQDNSIASSYTVTTPGLYWLDLTRNGCSFRDSVYVTYNPLPVVTLGNDTTICAGAVLQLNAFHPNTAGYLWQDGSSNSSFVVSTAGIYFVEATSKNGCKKRDSIIIQQIPLPLFNLGNDTIICSGTGLVLNTGINNNPNLWSTGAASSTITVNNPGLYWVEVTNNGCKKKDSINVSVKPNPVVNLGNDTLLCDNQTILLNASNSNSIYLWQDGSIQSQFNVTRSGIYQVTVNMNGCIMKDTITISYNYKPVFSLGADKEICEGYTILLDPKIGGGNYLWQDGSTGMVFTATKPGLYILRITNPCGFTEDSVLVKKGICNLYIPNSFTPNGDGLNDVFKIALGEPTTFFTIKVYNRFGQIIFESNDKLKGWNGKFNGIEQPVGAYVYIVDYILLSDGKKYHSNGSLILLR
jgi:gliding motility-associated-like protein